MRWVLCVSSRLRFKFGDTLSIVRRFAWFADVAPDGKERVLHGNKFPTEIRLDRIQHHIFQESMRTRRNHLSFLHGARQMVFARICVSNSPAPVLHAHHLVWSVHSTEIEWSE